MAEKNQSQESRLPGLELGSLLRDGDALLIVPPFATLKRPSLAAHLLQACAKEAGIRVSVFYANMTFGALIGEETYEAISKGPPTSILIGEQLFAPAAYNVPSPAGSYDRFDSRCRKARLRQFDFEPRAVRQLQATATKWADQLAGAIVEQNFGVVGCTASFEQTSASVALLSRIKRLRPQTITIIGGANCEGDMAEGIASLSALIDFVFSGESEISLTDFLKDVLVDQIPSGRIISGQPCLNLDALPTPGYAEFFEQRAGLLPDSVTRDEYLALHYETSRGCWWYQKQRCTFCGLNGRIATFREKSPERVIHELRTLSDRHPSRRICMTDNIMPHKYFRTLIPQLADEVPNLRLFYEQKANLSLRQVLALKRAGINDIQPGIEALSTSLLIRMNKGVTGTQNLALLRYARSANVMVRWILLYGFPGDQLHEYEQTLNLLPLLHHLPPPRSLSPLRIDRFSLYYDEPADYGITNLRPTDEYRAIFPSSADIEKLAHTFAADYKSDSRENPDIICRLVRAVDAWKSSWDSSTEFPIVQVHRLTPGIFVLVDTRGVPGTQEIRFLNQRQASLALVGRPLVQTAEIEWALQCKLGLVLDSRYVPLATADPELLLEFEAAQRGMEQMASASTK